MNKNVTPYPKCLTPSLLIIGLLYLLLTCIYKHTYMHTLLQLSSAWLCGRNNSLHSADRLRQARARYTEVWIYAFYLIELYMTVVCSPNTRRRVHLALLGQPLVLFSKAVKDILKRNRKWIGCLLAYFASLFSVTFIGCLRASMQHFKGAINGRKCPSCGYKRTSAHP